MVIRAQESDLRLINIAFQAHYDEGFRFLDHCGATLVALRKQSPNWTTPHTAVSGSTLQNLKEKLTAQFDSHAVLVVDKEELTMADAQARVEAMGSQAELLYDVVVKTLNVPNTVRIGVRYTFVAEADSIEEADQFICKAITSNAIDKVREMTNAEIVDVELKITTEDEVGYRCHTRLLSRSKGDASLEYFGLPVDGLAGMAVVDIDTFTRPPTGHFPNTARFVIDTYAKAAKRARDLFRWLKQNQR